MIFGAHVLLFSRDAAADRAFLRDVLGLRAVDVGEGWLILALPPAEAAVHPSAGDFVQHHAEAELMGAVLYLMCDDVHATVASLEAVGAHCSPVQQADWGLATTIRLPSGSSIGLYQPTHETALDITR